MPEDQEQKVEANNAGVVDQTSTGSGEQASTSMMQSEERQRPSSNGSRTRESGEWRMGRRSGYGQGSL